METAACSERLIYQVADTDGGGVLIDLLGHALSLMTLMGRTGLKWSVFDLDWMQREEGILHWERVCQRSSERPDGWQLEDGGIRLFHAQSAQVVGGLFLAGPDHVILPAEETYECAISRSQIALEAFDSTFWRLSCSDREVAKTLIGNFAHVTCAPLVVHTPTGPR